MILNLSVGKEILASGKYKKLIPNFEEANSLTFFSS